MLLKPLDKISFWRKQKLFWFSYSGFAAFLGIFCLLLNLLYEIWWIHIDAPYRFMYSLGIVLTPVSLSVVASSIFYFITVYLPKRHRWKVESSYIRKWLQQLENYGECLLVDIAGTKDCTKEEFIASCDIILKSKPKNSISFREQTIINTWFDYFDNFFKWEYLYMQQVIKYGESIPAEILIEFEKYNQFDNLKIAILTYKENYDNKKIDYKNMKGFSNLLWLRAQSLRNLPNLYIKYSHA